MSTWPSAGPSTRSHHPWAAQAEGRHVQRGAPRRAPGDMCTVSRGTDGPPGREPSACDLGLPPGRRWITFDASGRPVTSSSGLVLERARPRSGSSSSGHVSVRHVGVRLAGERDHDLRPSQRAVDRASVASCAGAPGCARPCARHRGVRSSSRSGLSASGWSGGRLVLRASSGGTRRHRRRRTATDAPTRREGGEPGRPLREAWAGFHVEHVAYDAGTGCACRPRVPAAPMQRTQLPPERSTADALGDLGVTTGRCP